MLRYTTQHVSSIDVLILRRNENCMCAVSGIVTLCKLPYRALIDSGLKLCIKLVIDTSLSYDLSYCTNPDLFHFNRTVVLMFNLNISVGKVTGCLGGHGSVSHVSVSSLHNLQSGNMDPTFCP